MKSSMMLLVLFQPKNYPYKLSITKWRCGLMDKISHRKLIKLLNCGFKTSERLI